jgi:hypothetical protein
LADIRDQYPGSGRHSGAVQLGLVAGNGSERRFAGNGNGRAAPGGDRAGAAKRAADSASGEPRAAGESPAGVVFEKKVVRVRTLRTVREPRLSELIERAAERISYGGPTPKAFRLYLWGNIGRSDLGVFVGYEGSKPCGLVVCQLPVNCLMICPQLIIGYNEGSRELHKLATERIQHWLKENGWNCALAVNRRREHQVFARAFADFGKASVYGTIVRFDI